MLIDQAAGHCGVAIGMLSKLENGKGVNLEHALHAMDGLGLTMLVVPKAHAPWLEQAAAHAAKIGEDAVWLEESRGAMISAGVMLGCGLRAMYSWICPVGQRIASRNSAGSFTTCMPRPTCYSGPLCAPELSQLFPLECRGIATFDVALR
ncbi:hypothetical protein [Cupriavidus necator]|nr:hypothetical protein [Cupriavidus necator]MDX6008212.1 hypothetical protein [Cupriavidus necator]